MKLLLLAAAIGVGAFALGTVAWAGGAVIDDVELSGGGPTAWDPSKRGERLR